MARAAHYGRYGLATILIGYKAIPNDPNATQTADLKASAAQLTIFPMAGNQARNSNHSSGPGAHKWITPLLGAPRILQARRSI
jgi:hypothetical protein